jgi:hypothetical protein
LLAERDVFSDSREADQAYIRYTKLSDDLAPLYLLFVLDAIDSGQYKAALQTCAKQLKKQPNNDLIKVMPI